MKKNFAVAAVLFASCGVAVAAGPFDAFKGKMKEGMYEYKMDMDMGNMPGMPPGMGKQSHTVQRCVTHEDVEKGNFARSQNQKQDCEIRDMQSSGNTASYKMVCNGQHPMTADVKMTFRDNGFTSDMSMAMNDPQHPMNMKQHIESTYKGPCK